MSNKIIKIDGEKYEIDLEQAIAARVVKKYFTPRVGQIWKHDNIGHFFIVANVITSNNRNAVTLISLSDGVCWTYPVHVKEDPIREISMDDWNRICGGKDKCKEFVFVSHFIERIFVDGRWQEIKH